MSQTNWEFNFTKSKKQDLPQPFGYSKTVGETQEIERKTGDMKQLLENKLWQISTSGAPQIFMAFLMLWMMGQGLNLFTIIFTFQFIMQPLKNVLSVNSVFAQYQGKGVDLLQYKFYYTAIHGFILSIGLYKLYNIGLLPLAPADWIDLIPMHTQKEVLHSLQY